MNLHRVLRVGHDDPRCLDSFIVQNKQVGGHEQQGGTVVRLELLACKKFCVESLGFSLDVGILL